MMSPHFYTVRTVQGLISYSQILILIQTGIRLWPSCQLLGERRGEQTWLCDGVIQLRELV